MFEHLDNKIEFPELKNRKILMERGFMNIWQTNKSYPSITTVLSIRDKKIYMNERKKVGEEVANYIARTSANRAIVVHNMVEDYLNNVSKETLDEKHKKNLLAWVCLMNLNLF